AFCLPYQDKTAIAFNAHFDWAYHGPSGINGYAAGQGVCLSGMAPPGTPHASPNPRDRRVLLRQCFHTAVDILSRGEKIRAQCHAGLTVEERCRLRKAWCDLADHFIKEIDKAQQMLTSFSKQALLEVRCSRGWSGGLSFRPVLK